MMSNGQVLYDDSGHLVGKWRPHIMIYSPGLTNMQVGLPATPDVTIGLVSEEGTPEANLTIMMSAFVPVASGSPAPRSR